MQIFAGKTTLATFNSDKLQKKILKIKFNFASVRKYFPYF